MAADPTTAVYEPHEFAKKDAHVNSMEQYRDMYHKSVEDPGAFWTDIARDFHFNKGFDQVLNYNYSRKKGKVHIEWFLGSETNVCYNAIDRHVIAGKGDRIAFYWEGNDPSKRETITYAQLKSRVEVMANLLKSRGVSKGDTVAIYMPMIPDIIVAMLACTRIGAPHSIVFGGFSAGSLADRIIDAKSRVLITADGSYRGNKLIPLKQIADEAMAKCSERSFQVSTCIVAKNLEAETVSMTEGRDEWLHDAIKGVSSECPVEWVDGEHPLFLLYTSGSTGRPKGVVHSTAGYMVWAATTFKYTFDYHDSDVFFCTADVGWITGHSYITYGPLCTGATSVMFEGVPTYPDAGRLWRMVEDYKINSFYTAPTAIRALRRLGDDFPKKYNLTSLRVLGTVGEPINPEAWLWYRNVIGGGKASVVDTWWQTETGGHMITPLPGATPAKPGSATLPMFGVVPAVLDNEGNEIEGAGEGMLVIKKPWPGQMRTVFGDHERFEKTYFSHFDGFYFSGDGCRRDEDGYFWITGRVDDVVNVSGHRLGTAELEGAMAKHPDVAECAMVGIPHDVKGHGLYAFVILREGVTFDAAKEKELKNQIRSEIGAFAQPDIVQAAPGLPKTRSGKIMRRILRKIAHFEEETGLGDTSTLADPSVVQALLDSRPKKDAFAPKQ